MARIPTREEVGQEARLDRLREERERVRERRRVAEERNKLLQEIMAKN